MKRFTAVAVLFACAVTLVSLSAAQEASQTSPSMRLQVSAAIERTPEQMNAFDATAAMPAARAVPFRPTVDASQYAGMKQAAAMAPFIAKPGAASPAQLAAVSTKFGGATECDGPGGCWIPPDVAGAIGKAQFVSVSNNVFEVRSRAGLLLKTNSLNGLCGGYSAQPMFDPRVQWDEAWQRWVITAAAFPASSTSQIFCMAISKTSSATGSFWVYLVDVGFIGGTNGFYDFPMLGLADNAALFSANIFGATSFLGSSLFAVEKNRLYTGLGFSVPLYTGLIATLEPAHQTFTDQNPCAWLSAAPSGSGQIWMYRLCNPGNGGSSLSAPIAVGGVSAYSVPPSAPQPAACSGATLDTLDNRFQNAGTQNGDNYYQVHTINLGGGFPAPRYYVISGLSTSTPTVAASANIFASPSSWDFNPSIASDSGGHFGINWSYTDVAVLPSERFTDNNGSNPVNSTGINVFTSASCYNTGTPQRWGDYSQTTVDPGSGVTANSNTKIFWIDNETVPSLNFWSTEIAKMKY
jgi:hypothetical protein